MRKLYCYTTGLALCTMLTGCLGLDAAVGTAKVTSTIISAPVDFVFGPSEKKKDEKSAKEKEAKEKAAKEKEAKEKAAKEKEAEEKASKEKEAKETKEKESKETKDSEASQSAQKSEANPEPKS